MPSASRRFPHTDHFASFVLVGCLLAMAGCGPSASDSSSEPLNVTAALASLDPPANPSAGTSQEPPDDSANESAADEPESKNPFSRRTKAPSLSGGLGWINTAGPLDIEDLRGKFVVLDFWTYCCINCMHVLPELKKLEKAYPNEIVVIGVHSAKFDTEKGTDNIRDAVMRYQIEHPVINDAQHRVWTKYSCQSWPSLRIIDPEGYLVAGHSGEATFEALDGFFKKVIPYYREQGLLDETPLRFDLEAYRASQTPLRFPGKVLADAASDRLFIADSNHNRIVIATLDGQLIDTIGSGAIGAVDGDFATASFDHPQGMALGGETLYVADTENHLLRKISLDGKTVETIAGIGTQWRGPWPGMEAGPDSPPRFVGPPRTTGLNSPWALWIHKDDLYIAMAGPHQIWKMRLDESEIGPYAGNGREDIVDGPLISGEPYALGSSSFAQPSGLASDGTWLYVADSEGSSIRAVPFDPNEEVRTIIGTADLDFGRLFTFGDVDGPYDQARMQHALGVVFDAGLLYVADTYNDKIKVIDLSGSTIKTIAGKADQTAGDEKIFDEPAGISFARGTIYVADTNLHRIRTIDLKNGNQVETLEIEGLSTPTPPAPTTDKPVFPNAVAAAVEVAQPKIVDGQIRLAVALKLPEGYELNPLAPMVYYVSAEGEGAVDRTAIGKLQRVDPPANTFDVSLPVSAEGGNDELQVSLTYYYCRKGAEGLCKVGSVIWTVPVEITTGDSSEEAIRLDYELK